MGTKNDKQLVLKKDSKTSDVIGVIKGQLASLAKVTETPYKTANAVIPPFTNAVKDETKVENLVRMHSLVTNQTKAYDDSQSTLTRLVGGEIAIPPYRINGYSAAEFESDIVLRLKVLQVSKTEAKLKSLLAKAEGFYTQEEKREAFLEELAAFGTESISDE